MAAVTSTGNRVAVVGAGATGLAAAVLLTKRGIGVDVFEQRPGPCTLPQAHVVNTRTSEILVEVGAFEALRARAAPLERVKRIAWVESLAGRRFGALDLIADEASALRRRNCSAVQTLNVGQNHFEEVLAGRLAEIGGTVRYRHQIIASRIVDGHAELTIVGPDCATDVRTYDHVLACDGANSTLRDRLGIEMVGPPSLARYASAYFTADLAHLTGDISGPVTFIGGADVRGPLIGFDLDRTWAFMCVMPPGATSQDFSADVMSELIRRAIGDRDVAIELLGVSAWNMSAQVAERFREGPFFLVGDAAHRFPPTGGLGLNTGVQDAHNLAWKLAFVLGGQSHPTLLASYEGERRPVALRNCQQSLSNAMHMSEVDEALGVAFLAPVDPAVSLAPSRALPDPHLDCPTGPARAKRDAVDAAIERQRPHFDSLQLELGFVYGAQGGATVDDHDYVPGLAAGARAPHLAVSLSHGFVSLHALAATDGLVLLTGADADLTRLPTLPRIVAVHATRSIPAAGAEGVPMLSMGSTELVLLRPDGHVAWHGRHDDSAGLSDALSALVKTDTRVAPIGSR